MSADTLAERIREIKEREAKATKGPWKYRTGDDNGFYQDGVAVGIYSPRNSAFIAHARADIPYLLEQLEKASAAEQWKTEVIDALVVNHIYVEAHETNPRKALRDLISWETKIALDPKVSKEARDLEQAARKEEREQCCKDVCVHCRHPERWNVKPAAKVGSQWKHQSHAIGDDSFELVCDAAAIRNRE